MSVASTPGEDDITTQLKTIQGVDVMESDYVDDSYIPETDDNKMFKPYLLVKFNGGFEAYDNGIVGPDKDTQRASFTVFVVTPDDRTTRTFRDKVREKMLTNFQPTDGSSLKPGNSYSFVDPDLGFHRYVHAVSFSYRFNLS